jgi:hypothetical protein
MPLDVCVVGEINPDLILYGLPAQFRPEQESLIDGFRLTLGSSSDFCSQSLSPWHSRRHGFKDRRRSLGQNGF